MMKDKEYIHTLLEKYSSGEYRAEELDTLLEYNSKEEGAAVISAWLDKFLAEAVFLSEAQSTRLDILLERTDKKMLEAVPLPIVEESIDEGVRTRVLWKRLLPYAAAAVLLSLAISVYIWQYSYPAFNPEAPIFTKRASVVLPNGKEITLDNKLDPNDSILLRQNGLAVSMDGTIRLMDESMGNLEPKEVMTRIQTPRGGEYSVELSDGTVVQLNAESSLEFPVQFVGDQRQVKLRGEGYFDVVKDAKRPFIVNADDRMGVKVLGTSFNVSTYAQKVSTTLIEGVVQVNALQGQHKVPVNIKPGETASIDNAGGIKVENLDLDKAIAWKSGVFNFNNCTMTEIAEELERWYDIRVVLDPEVAHVRFYGEFERQKPLANAIKLLEAVGVKVELKGKTLKLNEK